MQHVHFILRGDHAVKTILFNFAHHRPAKQDDKSLVSHMILHILINR